jgi:integrase
MRVSEALALETKHLINNGRTIIVEQQVEKNAPRIVQHLKTDAAKREVDLHPDIAGYLRNYIAGKTGLLFKGTTPPISTAIWKPAGSLQDLNRWGWTRREWVSTPSSDSARRGSAANAVWKI